MAPSSLRGLASSVYNNPIAAVLAVGSPQHRAASSYRVRLDIGSSDPSFLGTYWSQPSTISSLNNLILCQEIQFLIAAPEAVKSRAAMPKVSPVNNSPLSSRAPSFSSVRGDSFGDAALKALISLLADPPAVVPLFALGGISLYESIEAPATSSSVCDLFKRIFNSCAFASIFYRDLFGGHVFICSSIGSRKSSIVSECIMGNRYFNIIYSSSHSSDVFSGNVCSSSNSTTSNVAA